jgi:hypothetical protein
MSFGKEMCRPVPDIWPSTDLQGAAAREEAAGASIERTVRRTRLR